MAQNGATRAIQVVPSGDLRVHVKKEVGTTLSEFIVSSGALRMASPVWSAMLDPQGPFQESRKSEISLIGDDPQALLILMHIAHMQFNQIQAAVSYKDLLALSILCDKYDTVTLIRPWADQWIQPYIKKAAKCSYRGYEGLAFIAWTLGKPGLFWNVAQYLVANVTFDSSGRLLHEGKVVDVMMPTGLVEAIQAFRVQKLVVIINICLKKVNIYMRIADHMSNVENASRCLAIHRSSACDSLNFGNLILRLTGLGLWPDQDFARRSKSLNDLIDGLLDLPEMSLSNEHGNCGFYRSLKREIKKIADVQLPADSLPECEEHMEVQMSK